MTAKAIPGAAMFADVLEVPDDYYARDPHVVVVRRYGYECNRDIRCQIVKRDDSKGKYWAMGIDGDYPVTMWIPYDAVHTNGTFPNPANMLELCQCEYVGRLRTLQQLPTNPACLVLYNKRELAAV